VDEHLRFCLSRRFFPRLVRCFALQRRSSAQVRVAASEEAEALRAARIYEEAK